MTELLRDDLSSFGKWTNSGQTIAAARNGNGFQSVGSFAIATLRVPGYAETDTVTIGFAWRTNSLGVLQTMCELGSDLAADGITNTVHSRITVSTTGQITVNRGTNTAIATSATGVIAINTWYYVEIQSKLSDTVGQVTVRLDGTAVITSTATLDTKNLGTKTTYDSIKLGGGGTGVTMLFDDFYLRNDATFNGDPGAVTTTATTGRSARQQLRALTNPYAPNSVVDARQQMRVLYSLPPPNTAWDARHQLRVLVQNLPTATVKVWNGSAFVDAPVKVWNGSAFVDAAAVKTWNGSAFV